MNSLPRRQFLKTALAAPLAGAVIARAATARAATDGGEPERHVVHLGAQQDRFGERRKVFGFLPIDVKVSGSDTGGGLLLIEQVDDRKGGPPKHVHHSQEEWFYVVDGNYVIDVGDERFELGRGASVLAPRGIPHVWAHTGDGVGRLLIGFQPAGAMEDFFAVATRLDGIPSGADLARLFREHGMEVLGPPLAVTEGG